MSITRLILRVPFVWEIFAGLCMFHGAHPHNVVWPILTIEERCEVIA